MTRYTSTTGNRTGRTQAPDGEDGNQSEIFSLPDDVLKQFEKQDSVKRKIWLPGWIRKFTGHGRTDQ